MRAIYVTGGGKCGTHIVARFLAANWPSATLHPIEFKTWHDDLPAYLCDKFVFHKPPPDIARFRQICPSGKALVLLRNPAQHYMAWLCTYAQGIISRRRKHAVGLQQMHREALARVLCGFSAVPEADAVWQLEDFASAKERRIALVRAILDGDSRDEDPPITVSKSRFGLGNGVQLIRQDEYRAILTEAEIETFDRADINVFYPRWKDGLALRDRSDAERVHERFVYIVAAARRRMAGNLYKKGKPLRALLLKLKPIRLAAHRAAVELLRLDAELRKKTKKQSAEEAFE